MLTYVFLLLSPLALASEPFFIRQDIPLKEESGYWVSEWIEAKVPSDIESFQIITLGSEETLLQITDLIDPNGQEYLSSTTNSQKKIGLYDQPVLRNVVSPNRSEAVSPGTGTLLVPNNPLLPKPQAGIWRLRTLSHHEPQKKSVSIWMVEKKGKNQRKIPIRVWLAKNAWENESENQQILQGAQSIYAQIGFDLEIVSVKRLKESFTKALVLPSDMSSLAWKKNINDAINIYLMPEMEYQNKPVNGLACLAGPAVQEITHSCFVALFAGPNSKAVPRLEKSRILAHEIGHYLGLFHTTDTGYYGIKVVHDPLPDTPEEITGTNMMDPGVREKDPVFSPSQIKMMLTSPILTN